MFVPMWETVGPLRCDGQVDSFNTVFKIELLLLKSGTESTLMISTHGHG